jgi:hypothetical protein
MRWLASLCLISFLSAGIAAAQETSFPVGPQYLIPGSASSLFLQPIATPTLSLQNVPAPPAIAFERGTVVPASPMAPAPFPQNLLPIYYGYPIPAENLPSSTENAVEGAENPIEITSSSLPANLPASIFDTGVTRMVNPETLREAGYGLSVADAASYWKAHKAPAVHVYTNADVARLHGG